MNDRIYLNQWFPNFKCDPNLSVMNILQPKPKTSKLSVFYMLKKRKCFKLLYYTGKLSYYQP